MRGPIVTLLTAGLLFRLARSCIVASSRGRSAGCVLPVASLTIAAAGQWLELNINESIEIANQLKQWYGESATNS